MNTQKKTNAKAVKLGTYSAFLTLVVIAIVAVVNLLVGELPSTLTKFDFSSNSMYTVSDTTVDILKGLKEDVTMYYIVSNGSQAVELEEMLQRYASYTSRIKVVEVDPTVNPTFTAKYTDSTLTANSVIVESAKRHTVVSYEEIYVRYYTEDDQYYYQMTGQMPSGTPYFNGEGCLTSALDYVTSESIPVLYVTTGHGEMTFDETAAKDVKAENILAKELTLLTTPIIPDDASAVLLHYPTKDLATEEVETLRAFLAKGGNVILLSGYGTMNKVKMPNLMALMAEWGMQATDGVVAEGDSEHHLTQNPFYLIPTLNTAAPIAANITSQSTMNLIPLAHGITQIEGVEGKSFTPVLTTSEKAYALIEVAEDTTEESTAAEEGAETVSGTEATNTSGNKENKVDLGKVSIAAHVTDGENGGQVLWISGYLFVDPIYGSSLYSYNADLFMSAMTVLCEKTSMISILGKSMQIYPLNVTEQAVWFWGIMLVLVVPVGTGVFGLVIWNRRRKR